jgi:hypothetical protein
VVQRALQLAGQFVVGVAAGCREGGVDVGEAALQVSGGDDGLAVFKNGFVAVHGLSCANKVVCILTDLSLN